MSDEERQVFTWIDEQDARLAGDQLILTLDLSRPLSSDVRLSDYLFGYRPDRPFTEMPKLQVLVGESSHAVFDAGRRLPVSSVQVRRHRDHLEIHLPLALLVHPQWILTSARTVWKNADLDWVAWRVLEVGNTQTAGPGG